MDVQMPVMDGLEATRRIRAHQQFATLPIIAMTASALDSDRLRCLQAGMNDQVNKPIDVPELFATLRRWVRPEAFTSWATPELERLTESDEGELPESIPGIDIEKALKRLGSATLLRQVLTSFRQENLETMQSLHAALAQGDDQLVQRIIHTVKGVGGNLGATELASAAHALEEAMEGADADVLRSRLETLEEKLSQLLAAIHTLEQREAQTAAAPQELPAEFLPVDRERAGRLVRELQSLLATSNLNALGVWEELKPLLADVNTEQLDVAMASLNFPEASKTLQSIAASIGIKLTD
jgi:CheY-like chemotaxis protein